MREAATVQEAKKDAMEHRAKCLLVTAPHIASASVASFFCRLT